MVFNGPAFAPLDRGSAVTATFAGAEANLAIAMARLGHPVRWLSVVGDDLFGRIITRSLRGEGVDVSRVRTSSAAPTAMMVKNRRSFAEPEVYYYRAGSAFSQSTPAAFGPDCWRDAKIIHLTGITPALSAGCRDLVRSVLEDARAHGIPVWLDPNFRRKLWSEQQARETLLSFLPWVDVLLAGLDEGRLLTGSSDPATIAVRLLEAGAREVVLKAGTAGGHCFARGVTEWRPAFPVRHLVDPIGAGDAFVAGFLSARLRGHPTAEALRWGNAVGAIVAGSEGDWEGLPRLSDLERFLSCNAESER